MLFAIPGLPAIKNDSLIYHHMNQFFAVCPSGVLLITYDSFFITIGIYFVAVLSIFRDIIKCLDNSNLNNRKILKIYYLYHCDILAKFHLFNNVFTHILSAQAMSNTAYIFILFYLVVTTGSFVLFTVVLIFYILFATLCIFGELIFAKSEMFFADWYLTNWYEFRMDDQKFLLMMLYATRKPLGVKVARIYDINSVLLLDVTKMAFSFCTILYTFNWNKWK